MIAEGDDVLIAAELTWKKVTVRWLTGEVEELRGECALLGHIRKEVCRTIECLWSDIILLCPETNEVLSNDDAPTPEPPFVTVVKLPHTVHEHKSWVDTVSAHAKFQDVEGLQRARKRMEEELIDPTIAFEEVWFASITDVRALDSLAEAGVVDINTRGAGDRNLLHQSAEQGFLPTVEMLFEKGADVNIGDVEEATPLQWASIHGHTSVVEALLSHGALPNKQNKYGNSALHWAARAGFADVCTILIEHGADPNLVDNGSLTPLHWGAWEGHTDTSAALISCGADVNSRNGYGNTPLHWATRVGRLGVTKLLISSGAEVNMQNKDGRTALHDAVFHGFLGITERLIQAGADPYIETDSGKSCLYWASGLGKEPILAALLKAQSPGSPRL